MPRLFIAPSPVKKGKGTASGTRKVLRPRRKARSYVDFGQKQTKNNFIGQDLVESTPQSTTARAKSSNINKINTVSDSRQQDPHPNETREPHVLCFDTRVPGKPNLASQELTKGQQDLIASLQQRGILIDTILVTQRGLDGLDVVRVETASGVVPVFLQDSDDSSLLSTECSWFIFTRMMKLATSQATQNARSPKVTIVTSEDVLGYELGYDQQSQLMTNFCSHLDCTSATRVVVTKSVEAGDAKGCVNTFRSILNDLAEKMPPVQTNPLSKLSFGSIAPNLVGVQGLVREIVRDSLCANRSFSVSFDLPMVEDGTQCCLSLDIQYNVLPYRLDDSRTKSMMTDLEALCSRLLKPIQLLPLDAVDASLLYGIPMRVQSSVLGSFADFEEVETLTRTFFAHLVEKQVAVLLENESAKKQYILMAQENPVGSEYPPRSGILFQYASRKDMLTEFIPPSGKPNVNDEIGQQYAVYMDSALGGIPCAPLNPLIRSVETQTATPGPTSRPYRNQVTPSIEIESSSEDDDVDEKRWNDDSGIGATCVVQKRTD